MMRQMLAVTLLLMGGAAQLAKAQVAGPLVIHRREIQAAGWGRVSELVQGAAGWQSSDVEGFDATASADGLPPAGESAPGAAEWIVLVDGQRVPTNLFGVHQLDLLPISIQQVDSVVVTSGPTVIGGSASSRGAIQIFTRAAARGFSGEVTYEHGDETGDPGPFRYTARSSLNVEKIGPFGHAQVGWSSRRWDVTFGLHGSSLNTTDSIIASRVGGRGPVDIDALSPTAQLRVRALGGQHELLATRGEERGDLFLSNEQREQSIRSTDTYVGARGTIADSARTSAAYGLATSTQRVTELPSGLPFTMGHQRRMLHAEASVTRRDLGPLSITGGLAGDHWQLERGDTSLSATSERGFVNLTTQPRADRGAALTLALVHAKPAILPQVGTAPTTALDGDLELRQALRPMTQLSLSLSRVHELSGDGDSWIDREVAGIAEPTEGASTSRAALRLSQRVRWLDITLGAQVTRANDWPVLDPPPPVLIVVDSQTVLLNPDVSLETVTLGGFGARLATADSGRVRGYVEFDHSAVMSGGVDIRAAERAAASDQLRGQIAYVPFTDVQLGLGASLVSSTHWVLFPGFDGALVPAKRRLDASVEKWFWHRRLRAAYLLENLLNQPDRDHPYGAQWNLRFHIAVGAQFGFSAL